MSRKIVINPVFKDHIPSIEDVIYTFETQGEVIQSRRNLIKTISYKSITLNIKRYKKPIFINRMVYTFVRKTKASKAYHNALKVLEKGFNTPSPIAYIEEKRGNLLSLSYFISLQLNGVQEIRNYYFSKVDDCKLFLEEFAKYTANLHDANILHLDYSPGNILFTHKNETFQFYLVDINRMDFCFINLKKGCENFCRLFEHDEILIYIAKIYARHRGFDIDECIRTMLFYKHRFEKKKGRKKRLKNIFKLNKQ